MMKSARTCALSVGMLSVMVAGLGGCRHKAPPPPPPVSTAPPLQPSSITHVPTVPPLPAPATPQVGAPGSDQKVSETKPPPPPRSKHAKKHPVVAADTSAPAPALAPTASAAAPGPGPALATGPAPAPAPAPGPAPTLGQLSAGTGADSHERAVMSEQIREQETRLSKLKHPLHDDGEAITQQIRVFLLKARQAVSESDLDGAQTLTTKAKVLLDELTQS